MSSEILAQKRASQIKIQSQNVTFAILTPLIDDAYGKPCGRKKLIEISLGSHFKRYTAN